MKTRFLFLIIVCFLSGHVVNAQEYNKQHTCQDAYKLKKIDDQMTQITTMTEFKKLLSSFYSIAGLYSDDTLRSNPFFSAFLISLAEKEAEIIVEQSRIKIPTYKIPSAALILSEPGLFSTPKTESVNTTGGNWQAAIIGGTANFMAGRFKEEALHFGINQVFEKMTVEDKEIILALFPKTAAQIDILYNNGKGTYYTADLLYLRQLALLDMRGIPENMIQNFNTVFPKSTVEPQLKDILLLSSTIIKYSRQSLPLPEIISMLANQEYQDKSIESIVNMADLISQALLDTINSKDLWVNPLTVLNPLNMNINNEKLFFYGLLYEQLKDIPVCKDYLGKFSGEKEQLAIELQKITQFVVYLNSTYRFAEEKEFIFKSVDDLLIYVKEIANSINSLIFTLNRIHIIDISEERFEYCITYIDIYDAFIRNDFQRAIPLLLTEFGKYMAGEGKYTRSMAFISQMVTIEDPEDFEALLQAYALPIGSSSIKRNSKTNISINGYVGLTGGREMALGDITQWRTDVGLAAPIGISVTKFKGNVSFFASFIDLGSIVNQRINNDTVSYSNLKLEHFFTPGAGIFYNFPKAPVSIGVHLNYIPDLRTIKYENNTAVVTNTNVSVVRFNISALVDIPFFTLYNKSKK